MEIHNKEDWRENTMTDQINAKEYNFWDLMSGDFIFNIPDYQRPYSWSENEAMTLWDDLLEFWHDSKGNIGSSYFVGSIVLVKASETPESEVIDGQQRLSTLSLILSILLNYSTDLKKDIQKCLWEEGIQHKKIAGRSRLTLRKRDAFFFEKYVSRTNIDELLELDPKTLPDDAQRLLFRNAGALKKQIQLFFENHPGSIDSFITTLFNQCFFVVVTTPDNESAFRVFSVMNNRGLSLLPSDIIKAHIIGEIDDDYRQYYADKWEDIEVELGRESFNSLLSHIRMVYARNKLHGTLVSEFEKVVFKNIQDKSEAIINIIEPYAQAYKSIVNMGYVATTGADEVNELLYWLNRIDDSDWIPALMCALVEKGKDSSFILEFIKLLERLASCLYLTSKTSNQRIERYGRVIWQLQNGSCEEVVKVLELSGEEKKELLEVLDGDVYLMPARKRSFLILRLDRFLSDKAATYQNSIFSIEHVMPQKPKKESQWMLDWADDDTREYWLHKLANLVPLTRKKNSQAQNYEFATKKEKYFCDKNGITSYALTTEIIAERVWTPEVVAERQKRLIGIFAKYWKLYSDSHRNSVQNVEKKQEKNQIIAAAEKTRQDRLKAELAKYYAQNPQSKLPKLPSDDLKVGEYVHQAMSRLSESNYSISQDIIDKLCTVEASKKYTHRNLPYLVPVDEAVKGSNMMKRYWTRDKYIEEFNGKKYYIYSQWYPDHKEGSDARKSDFLQLFLDIALEKI